MAKGFDLSHWKVVTSWTQVKNTGMEFCYLKATDGLSTVDPSVDAFFKACKQYGILVGLYHYAELNDPVQEALHFKSLLDKYSTYDLLPVLDVEVEKEGFDYNTWIRTFQKTLGIEIMLYTGDGFIQEYGINVPEFKLWVARYGSQPYQFKSGGWNNYNIYQYSESSTLAGVQGSVDMNTCDDLNSILVNPPKEEDEVEKVPYDENQFKYLVELTRGTDQGKADWAKNEIAKMFFYITGGALINNGGKTTEAAIVYNKVMVPVSDILDLLGIKYSWDDSTKTVQISPN